MRIVVEVHNLKEARDEIEKKLLDLSGPAMTAGVQRATMLVTRDAKKLAPVDTGRLRASITPSVASEVASRGSVIQGIVGTNVDYAPHMEFGTEPHMPPVAALEPWASRHGKTAWGVALKIKARGTAPRLFLWRALNKNRENFKRVVSAIIRGIIQS